MPQRSKDSHVGKSEQSGGSVQLMFFNSSLSVFFIKVLLLLLHYITSSSISNLLLRLDHTYRHTHILSSVFSLPILSQSLWASPDRPQGSLKRDFYAPDDLPDAQTTASKNWWLQRDWNNSHIVKPSTKIDAGRFLKSGSKTVSSSQNWDTVSSDQFIVQTTLKSAPRTRCQAGLATAACTRWRPPSSSACSPESW